MSLTQDCSELLFATDELQASAVEAVPVSAAQDTQPKLAGESSYGPDDMTCAICLEQIQLEDTAYVKGCEHAYCAKCILHWAGLRADSSCPQCKKPFSRLLTYRMLDGTLNDFPTEESVCLLQRATWVQDQLKTAEKGKAVASSDAFYTADAAEPVTDWQDYSNYYDEYDDDEEVEDFYFSSAAGRARIVLGNRRWGENGYVASGRQQARPVHRTPKATPGSSGKKGSANKAAAASKEDKSAEPKPAETKEPSAAAEPTTASSEALVSPAAAKSSSAAQESLSLRKAVGRSDSNAGSPMVMPATPVAIQGSNVMSAGRRSCGFDVAGTSSDSLWGSSNSGSGWNAYERGKKAAGKQQGLMGSSPSNEGGNSKAGRRARRNAKKAAADAKADVYAY